MLWRTQVSGDGEAYTVQSWGYHFFFTVRLQLDNHHTTVKHTQPTEPKEWDTEAESWIKSELVA